MSTAHVATIQEKKLIGWLTPGILAEGKDTDNNLSLMWQPGTKARDLGPIFMNRMKLFW